MTLSYQVALSTLLQIIGKAITVLFSLLTTSLLTTYFGLQAYGDYMYILTVVVLFGSLVDWGTLTIGLRELAHAHTPLPHLFSNLLILRFGLSFLGILGLLVFSLLIPDPHALRPALHLSTLILFFTAAKASFGLIYQARLTPLRLVLADILTGFFGLLFSWLVTVNFLSLAALIFLTALAACFGFLYLLVSCLSYKLLTWTPDFKLIWTLFRESLPLGVILLLFSLLTKLATLLLYFLHGSSAVGIYALVYRLYDVLLLPSAYLMTSLLPVFATYRFSSKIPGSVTKIYQYVFDLLILLALILITLLWFLAPTIVQLLTGPRFPEFAQAILVLRLLVLALVFSYLNHLTGYTLVAFGYQKRYLPIPLLALVFNFILNLVFIPRFSFFAAALITVLTEFLVFLCSSYFVARLVHLRPSFTHLPQTLRELISTRGQLF